MINLNFSLTNLVLYNLMGFNKIQDKFMKRNIEMELVNNQFINERTGNIALDQEIHKVSDQVSSYLLIKSSAKLVGITLEHDRCVELIVDSEDARTLVQRIKLLFKTKIYQEEKLLVRCKSKAIDQIVCSEKHLLMTKAFFFDAVHIFLQIGIGNTRRSLAHLTKEECIAKAHEVVDHILAITTRFERSNDKSIERLKEIFLEVVFANQELDNQERTELCHQLVHRFCKKYLHLSPARNSKVSYLFAGIRCFCVRNKISALFESFLAESLQSFRENQSTYQKQLIGWITHQINQISSSSSEVEQPRSSSRALLPAEPYIALAKKIHLVGDELTQLAGKHMLGVVIESCWESWQEAPSYLTKIADKTINMTQYIDYKAQSNETYQKSKKACTHFVNYSMTKARIKVQDQLVMAGIQILDGLFEKLVDPNERDRFLHSKLQTLEWKRGEVAVPLPLTTMPSRKLVLSLSLHNWKNEEKKKIHQALLSKASFLHKSHVYDFASQMWGITVGKFISYPRVVKDCYQTLSGQQPYQIAMAIQRKITEKLEECAREANKLRSSTDMVANARFSLLQTQLKTILQQDRVQEQQLREMRSLTSELRQSYSTQLVCSVVSKIERNLLEIEEMGEELPHILTRYKAYELITKDEYKKMNGINTISSFCSLYWNYPSFSCMKGKTLKNVVTSWSFPILSSSPVQKIGHFFNKSRRQVDNKQKGTLQTIENKISRKLVDSTVELVTSTVPLATDPDLIERVVFKGIERMIEAI